MRLITTPKLADAYAQASAEAKRAAKEAETLRKLVLKRMEAEASETLTGKLYTVKLARTFRELLDQEKVREILSPRQIVACTKRSTVLTLNSELRDEVIVKEVA